jgi:hypothetical protein
MRDSVNGHLIPPGTPVVAGYADGIYAWSQDMWDAHPDAVHLSIAVHPDHQADILDVERFDATPADVPGWIDRFSRPARRRPTVYCARSAIDADGARILVWMFRLQLFGPAALSEPNAQAAVDAFAARIAGGENAEAVLTALLEAAQIDGRLDARYRFAPGA